MAYKAGPLIAAFKAVGAAKSLAEVTCVDALAIFAETGTAVVVFLAAAAEHTSGSIVVVADIAQRLDVLAAHALGTGIAAWLTGHGAKACLKLFSPDNTSAGSTLAIGPT